MTFLQEPATKRDLVAGSSVVAVLVVLAIIAAVVVAIRLHEAVDEVRGRLDHEHATAVGLERDNRALEGELVEVRQAGAAAEAAQVAAAQTVGVLRRRVVTLEESGASGAQGPPRASRGPGALPSPSGPAPAVGGPVAPRGDTPPPAGGGTPEPGSRSPGPGRPGRPRPPRGEVPFVPPPVVAPPIVLPPRPAPPVAAPPIVTPAPPRPGNKPPHAPCPPRNPNCG